MINRHWTINTFLFVVAFVVSILIRPKNLLSKEEAKKIVVSKEEQDDKDSTTTSPGPIPAPLPGPAGGPTPGQTSATTPEPSASARMMPAFLFSGQSNIIGHPNEAGDRYASQHNVTAGLDLESILAILNDTAHPLRGLMTEINKVDDRLYQDYPYSYPVGTKEVEAVHLVELRRNYPHLVAHLTAPMKDVNCSFLNLYKDTDDANDKPHIDYFTQSNPMSPNSSCGEPWGPELVFSHTLDYPKPFVVAKVASGGSELYRDWQADNGTFWPYLQDFIHQTKYKPCGKTKRCEWKAFVWFQGENDTFEPENAQGYLGNLTKFVQSIQREIAQANNSPIDIPVIIVQLGKWRQSTDLGKIVCNAQANYCLHHQLAELVTTLDLSPFYHYEAAAQLLIGERVAKALESLMIRSNDKSDDMLLP